MNTETENMKEQLLGLMESLKPTPELCNDAAESLGGDNYDDTDKALVRAIKEIINFERGLGPDAGSFRDFNEVIFGVGVAGAVGWAAHIDSMLADNPEAKGKLVAILTRAAFRDAPEEVKAVMEPAMEQLGSAQAIFFLWALFNEGVKQGMIMGWRAHELALLASVEAPAEGE